MKDIQLLIDRFEDVSNAAMPEEMIGAYLEGSLMGADLRMAQNVFNDNERLYDFMDEMSNESLSETKLNVWETNAGFEDNLSEISSGIGLDTETLFDETVNSIELNEQELPDLPILPDDINYDCGTEHLSELPSMDNLNEMPSIDDFTTMI